MATQTISSTAVPAWIPSRAVRLLVARAIARREAMRCLAAAGITGRQARLLARGMASRVSA